MSQTSAQQKSPLHKSWDNDAKIVGRKKKLDAKAVPGTEVLETLEYNVFILDIKNRPINEKKVYSFIKQFKNEQFFMKEFPAIVDFDFVILDGQHRYMACKQLGLPFYFRFTDKLSIDNVADVQANAGWKNTDFLHAFIKQKNQDYVVLYRFIQRYKLSPGNACKLLAQSQKGGLESLGFYSGSFKVKDETKAHAQAKIIFEVGNICGNLHKDARFIGAMLRVILHPDYDHKRMLRQLDKYGSRMHRQLSTDEYVKNIEEVYSYKAYQENKVRFL